MSEPIRYNVKCGDEGYQIAESLGGEWVRYGDYARLQAEVERMSDVARYSAAGEGVVRTDSAGPLVVWKDYARLQAEVERLTAEKDQAECDYDNCQKRKVSIDNHRFDLFTENKNLKAEVERLRKAGDAMAEALNLNDDVFDNQDKREAQANWQAAKEGKPSV